MPLRRFSPGVAALDDKIYVTGGREYDWPFSSVDCYDPDTNTWSQVANMNIARRGHSLVSLHGRLYAIGGLNSIGEHDVDSVEVYDPDNDAWTLLQHKLDIGVTYSGACLMEECYTKLELWVNFDLKHWLWA